MGSLRTNTSWAVGLVFASAKLKPWQQYHLVFNGVLGDADFGQLSMQRRSVGPVGW